MALSYNWCRDASCSPPAVYDFYLTAVQICHFLWGRFTTLVVELPKYHLPTWAYGFLQPHDVFCGAGFSIILSAQFPCARSALPRNPDNYLPPPCSPAACGPRMVKCYQVGWPIFLNSHNYQEQSFLLKSCERRRNWARCMKWHLQWLHMRCRSKDKVSWKNKR